MAEPKDFWFVAVLKELPQARRERVTYVFVGAFLVALGLCLYFAPTITTAGGSGLTALNWLRRLIGK